MSVNDRIQAVKVEGGTENTLLETFLFVPHATIFMVVSSQNSIFAI